MNVSYSVLEDEGASRVRMDRALLTKNLIRRDPCIWEMMVVNSQQNGPLRELTGNAY